MVAGTPAPSHDDAHHDRPPRWSVGRVLLLAATGVCLYLFAPSIAEVFEASDKLGEVHPLAIPAILLLESASFLCVWILQRIALRTHGWFPIVTTQLAGNFFNRITPGGGATGTALQARMLVDAGFNAAKAGTAITVQSLLITAAVLVLPVLALPAIIAGTQRARFARRRGVDRDPRVRTPRRHHRVALARASAAARRRGVRSSGLPTRSASGARRSPGSRTV